MRLVPRRHVVVAIAVDAPDEPRVGRIASQNRIAPLGPSPPQRREGFDRKFPLLLPVVVAAGAIGAQQRSDLPLVGRRRGRHLRSSNEHQKYRE